MLPHICAGAYLSSNFPNASAPLTAFALAGHLAQFASVGKKLDWDVEKMQCTNDPAVNKSVRREYCKGWEVQPLRLAFISRNTCKSCSPSLDAHHWEHWAGRFLRCVSFRKCAVRRRLAAVARPSRDAVWRESGIVEKFPTNGPPVLWRAAVGGGFAGPVVAGGRVYVADRQTARDASNTADPTAQARAGASNGCSA